MQKINGQKIGGEDVEGTKRVEIEFDSLTITDTLRGQKRGGELPWALTKSRRSSIISAVMMRLRKSLADDGPTVGKGRGS